MEELGPGEGLEFSPVKVMGPVPQPGLQEPHGQPEPV